MFNMDEIHFLTHAGVIFAVYMFIMIILFFCFSPFVNAFFDAYDAGTYGDATVDAYAHYYSGGLRAAVNIAFACGFAIPITWFIFWVFHREPRFQNVDYRQWR
jgi:ascorbate-specific PTS system EIIC-type component UlaA